MNFCEKNYPRISNSLETEKEKIGTSKGTGIHPNKEMLATLDEYCTLAKSLEPSDEEIKNLSLPVFNYASKFLAEVSSIDAFTHEGELDDHFLDISFAQGSSISIDDIVDFIDNRLNKSGLNTASPNHFGYVPAGGIYASALADYITSVINRYATVYFCAPAIVRLENSMIRWLCNLFGYSEKSGGVFTSGGSMATLTAIVAARDKYELPKKDLPKTVVYLTQYSHHCIHKALKIAGLGELLIRVVTVDDAFKMDSRHLHTLIENDVRDGLIPWLVVATAGTTDVGSVDPIGEIESIGHKFNMWVHVDAAYGGCFMLAKKGQEIFRNVHKVDSMVIDPHKGLFLPYGIGCLIVNDLSVLLASCSYDASYLRDYEENPEHVSPADISLELTRNFRGLKLWLPLKLYGIGPFRAALEEKLLLAQFFYAEIQKIEGIQVVCAPELSVVTFRYLPKMELKTDEFNAALIKEIQSDGKVFLSSTLIQGHVYLRMACLSFRSHLENVQLVINVVAEKITSLNTVQASI